MTMTSALHTMYPEPGAWKRHGLTVTAGLIIIDRLLAMVYWGYESNPMVREIGMVPWMGLTAVVLGLMYHLWHHRRHKEQAPVRGVMALIAGMHGYVLVANMTVVMG